MTAADYFHAARMTLAVAAFLVFPWSVACLWAAIRRNDPDEWLSEVIGGTALIAILAAPIAGGLAILGWALK